MDVLKTVAGLAIGGAIGTIVTCLCIRLLHPLAERLNLIDFPGGRKHHTEVKPLVGGIAIFIGFTAALLTLPISLKGYRPLASASLLLMLVGILDDMHEISARARLGAEIMAGLLMATWGGVCLSNLGSFIFQTDIQLGWFSIPFTIFAVTGMINAVNMLDGSDGLAATLVSVQLGLLLFTALAHHFFVEARVILMLMSALFGFLLFNFPISHTTSARVFMGDAGSMFLGYVLSWFAIKLTQLPHQALYPVSALWILGLTLWDAIRVILFRLLEGKSPLKADRSHLHHVLQDRGFSSRQICLVMGGVSLILGLMGILGQHAGLMPQQLFFGYLIGFAIYCLVVRKLMHSNAIMGLPKEGS